MVRIFAHLFLNIIIYGEGGKVKGKLAYILIGARRDGNMGNISKGAFMTASKGLLVLFIVSAAKAPSKQVAHTQ